MKLNRKEYGTGWAWMCSLGVCHWAEPTKDALKRRSKPSPEAIAVQVRIIPSRRHTPPLKVKG